jgi:hypothetical protein
MLLSKSGSIGSLMADIVLRGGLGTREWERRGEGERCAYCRDIYKIRKDMKANPPFSSSSPNFNQTKMLNTRWSKADLKQLDALGKELGMTDIWDYFALRFEGKFSARQCRDKFQQRNPIKEVRTWTDREDDLLERLAEANIKWIYIPSYFPNRTETAVKNRYYFIKQCMQRRISREEEEVVIPRRATSESGLDDIEQ